MVPPYETGQKSGRKVGQPYQTSKLQEFPLAIDIFSRDKQEISKMLSCSNTFEYHAGVSWFQGLTELIDVIRKL